MAYERNPSARLALNYNQKISPDANPREVEAWALLTAATRLREGASAAATDRGASLREALLTNQRLWTIFQTSVVEPDCPLPRELRKNLLELSLFIDKQTIARLADLDPEKIGILLDINIRIAAGLQETPHQPAVPVAEARERPPAAAAGTTYRLVV